MKDKEKNIYIKSSDLKLFATMIKSGISPVEALSGISEGLGKRLKKEYMYLRQRLSEGIQFSEVFRETSIGKNSLYITLLEGAEGKGTIPDVLEQIAKNIESNKVRQNQIIGVLIYPAMVVVIVTLLILALLLFIIPNILPVIAMNKENIPPVTKVLIFLSQTLKTKWLHIIFSIIFFFTISSSFLFIKWLRKYIEKLFLVMPAIGKFTIAYLSLGYSMALYQSLSTTSDISSVFGNLANGSKSLVFTEEFKRIDKRIKEGIALNIAFSESKVFPHIWSIFTRVAEQTSSYESMFKNLHEYYEELFENASRMLMKFAEPTLMIIIGIIVGVLAYGIMAPLYGIMNSLK